MFGDTPRPRDNSTGFFSFFLKINHFLCTHSFRVTLGKNMYQGICFKRDRRPRLWKACSLFLESVGEDGTEKRDAGSKMNQRPDTSKSINPKRKQPPPTITKMNKNKQNNKNLKPNYFFLTAGFSCPTSARTASAACPPAGRAASGASTPSLSLIHI